MNYVQESRTTAIAQFPSGIRQQIGAHISRPLQCLPQSPLFYLCM
ncbi:uncharacterized protein METZ01_LOCUS495572, partial [marine metagenome]